MRLKTSIEAERRRLAAMGTLMPCAAALLTAGGAAQLHVSAIRGTCAAVMSEFQRCQRAALVRPRARG